jgi:DNA-binding NarL/FixJ family response regulator
MERVEDIATFWAQGLLLKKIAKETDTHQGMVAVYLKN